MIELRVLGSPEVIQGTESVRLSPKPLAVVTYLALTQPGRFVRRDTLLGVFWPDYDQHRARTALRQALYYLRKSLGEDVLTTRGADDVGVAAAGLACDAIAFDRAVREGNLETAVSLYHGPLLAGVYLSGCPEFENWLDGERGARQRAYSQALERLAAAAEASGDLPKAARWLRRRALADPHSGRVAILLMNALEAAGDRAEAIRAGEQHIELVRSELEAEPESKVLEALGRLRAKPHPIATPHLIAPGDEPQPALEIDEISEALAPDYRILEELGSGGMATVYLADDGRHQRQVAVKVLSPDYAAFVGPQRFLREIEIAAQLYHPHIVPLIDSGHAGRFLYYVMPFAGRETLRARLRRERKLKLPDALGITQQVAAALAYAHGRGIVHRDIKPENILLHEAEGALVADFGIALALSRAGGTRMTETGLMIGTPQYMSPEQAGGQGDVDARSDVYSLACVLYEMLAGEPLFTGATARDIMARHMLERIPSLRIARPTVSPQLSKVIQTALAKDPADRFETVEEFAQALTRTLRGRQRRLAPIAAAVVGGVALSTALVAWGVGEIGDRLRAPTAGSPDALLESTATVQVGVLPPEVAGGANGPAEQALLIQHLMASELTRHRGLAVIDPLSLNSRLEATTSGTAADPIDELRDWELRYVVRTVLAPARRGVKVTYTLTDAQTGSVAEAGTFTSTVEADLPVQIRQAAGRLLKAVDVASGGITQTLDIEPWLGRAPKDIAAVRAFLQGTDYAYRWIPGGREHFERALHLDPEFIAPRVWLVSSLATAGDTIGARKHVRVLQSLQPNATPFEQAMIGWAEAVSRGDLVSKVRHLRVALAHSPRNNILLYNLGGTLYQMGRMQEAVEPIREAVESRWRFGPLYKLWGLVAIETGELGGLRETLDGARGLAPHDPQLVGLLEALALFEGDVDAAQRYGASFRAQVEEGRGSGGFSEMVPVYLALARNARQRGELQTATVLLQRAVDTEPQRPLAHLELARVLLETGNRQAAEVQYRAGGLGEVTDPAALYLRGEVGALLGRDDDARRYLTQYLNVAPDGPDAVRARQRLRSLGAPSVPR
jgi:DNA-binding SARP family transcriptional activator/TolB-like protein